MAVATGTAALIAGLTAGGAQVYGSKKSSEANKKATQASLSGTDAALAYQKEQDAKAEARQALIDQREEQRFRQQEQENAPIRALRAQLLGAQAQRFGGNLGALTQAPRASGGPFIANPGQVSGPNPNLGSLLGQQEAPEGMTIEDLLSDRWGSRAEVR